MYQLTRQHDRVRQRTLEITFLEPSADAYAFTFGQGNDEALGDLAG